MKKVLILNLSCDTPPYDVMIDTALSTWDSIDVPNCETIYYCGRGKQSTENVIRIPIKDSLENMGHKTLAAFEWALANKEFDYIARVHSSCYVDKIVLMDYVETLPCKSLFSGIEADSQNGFRYLWGGGHYIISRDVIQAIVDNKTKWNHSYMEDESMSLVCKGLGIPFHGGRSCSINFTNNGILLLGYGGGSLEFHQWELIKPLKHFFYRVKQDGKRDLDKFIMEQLFKVLK